MKKAVLEFLMAFVLLACAYLLPLYLQERYEEMTASVEEPAYTIMIDAGHGAMDSGKVGINGALEKDINLSIAKMLKDYLEAYNLRIVMSRLTDDPLYKEGDSNRKLADMRKRIQLMEENKVQYVVSIHQNSYGQESVHGAQVFYYADSVEGEKLAQAVQDGFSYALGENNTRNIKPNRDYYLLVHSPAVAIICECGFLSNWEEAQLLITEEYQKKIAISIGKGILNYLGIEEEGGSLDADDHTKDGGGG